jgi:hypothetical protein
MAERKAIQTGKVTRLLKETAVDCILNIKQTNFTVENMLKVSENQQVGEVGEWGDYSVQDRRQGVFGNVRLYG